MRERIERDNPMDNLLPDRTKGPWCDSQGNSVKHSGVSYMLLCGDGTRCHVIYHGWGCCEGRKGRARCPPHKPVMCARKCIRNSFHCCDTLANYCQGVGGPRYCPSTNYGSYGAGFGSYGAGFGSYGAALLQITDGSYGDDGSYDVYGAYDDDEPNGNYESYGDYESYGEDKIPGAT